jgi:amino-acid N-acetyltransferase
LQRGAGKAIGCGQIKPHKDGTFELASIVVLPEWRGKGVARRIIEQLLEIHPGRLYLTCRSNLESLYQRFGFRTIQEEEMTSYFRRLNRIAHFISRIFHLPFSLLVMKRN